MPGAFTRRGGGIADDPRETAPQSVSLASGAIRVLRLVALTNSAGEALDGVSTLQDFFLDLGIEVIGLSLHVCRPALHLVASIALPLFITQLVRSGLSVHVDALQQLGEIACLQRVEVGHSVACLATLMELGEVRLLDALSLGDPRRRMRRIHQRRRVLIRRSRIHFRGLLTTRIRRPPVALQLLTVCSHDTEEKRTQLQRALLKERWREPLRDPQIPVASDARHRDV